MAASSETRFTSALFPRRSALGRIGHCVRVLAHVKRAIRADALPVIADRLCNGENMRFGKRAMQRRSPVSTGPETHQLVRVAQVRPALKIFAFKLSHVDQHL